MSPCEAARQKGSQLCEAAEADRPTLPDNKNEWLFGSPRVINHGVMAKKKRIRIDSNTRRDLYDKFADYTLDLSKLIF